MTHVMCCYVLAVVLFSSLGISQVIGWEGWAFCSSQ